MAFAFVPAFANSGFLLRAFSSFNRWPTFTSFTPFFLSHSLACVCTYCTEISGQFASPGVGGWVSAGVWGMQAKKYNVHKGEEKLRERPKVGLTSLGISGTVQNKRSRGNEERTKEWKKRILSSPRHSQQASIRKKKLTSFKFYWRRRSRSRKRPVDVRPRAEKCHSLLTWRKRLSKWVWMTLFLIVYIHVVVFFLALAGSLSLSLSRCLHATSVCLLHVYVRMYVYIHYN